MPPPSPQEQHGGHHDSHLQRLRPPLLPPRHQLHAVPTRRRRRTRGRAALQRRHPAPGGLPCSVTPRRGSRPPLRGFSTQIEAKDSPLPPPQPQCALGFAVGFGGLSRYYCDRFAFGAVFYRRSGAIYFFLMLRPPPLPPPSPPLPGAAPPPPPAPHDWPQRFGVGWRRRRHREPQPGMAKKERQIKGRDHKKEINPK